MNESKDVRVTLTMPEHIKEWYRKEAKRYQLTMSGYMAMLLIKHQESQENMELLKQMNLLNNEMNTGNIDVQDMAQTLAAQMQQLSKSMKNKNK